MREHSFFTTRSEIPMVFSYLFLNSMLICDLKKNILLFKACLTLHNNAVGPIQDISLRNP